ncbi:MAG TPA: ABC transporter substrate-binding protein [Bryobacteraceae bacterium]|nr:ABC transporter substrate-binding protein [Bryobacteraceae bacterium]
MRRSAFFWLAVLSTQAFGPYGRAATRPHYGGTLHIEWRGAVSSLDPTEPDRSPAALRLDALLFDHLVGVDDSGQPRPALAVAWQHDPAERRWYFRLRSGIRFHDGAPLSPTAAAAAVQATLKGAAVSPAADGITIQCETPCPDLPSELARAAGVIFARSPNGNISGTGPFQVARWEPGKHAVLTANENYWEGRPFLDAVEIDMGRSARDQLIDLELGRADVAEIGPGDTRRGGERGRKTWTSAPADLVALVFSASRPAEDTRVREALALSIDRAAIYNVLLQRQGEISGGLLPQWLSGYAFLFPTTPDLGRARRLAAGLPPAARSLSLSYDPAVPAARLLAERIAVNARDAGITLQVGALNPRADLRLVQAGISSLDPGRALADLSARLGLREAAEPDSGLPAAPEALYAAEKRLLEGFRVVPLFHVPEVCALSARVHTWLAPGLTRLGAWRLADVWLAESNP